MVDLDQRNLHMSERRVTAENITSTNKKNPGSHLLLPVQYPDDDKNEDAHTNQCYRSQ